MATQLKIKGFVEEVYEKEDITFSSGSFCKQYFKLIPEGENYPLYVEVSGTKLDETVLEEFSEQDVVVDIAVYSKMTDEGRVFNTLVLYNISKARAKKVIPEKGNTGKVVKKKSLAQANRDEADEVPF